MRDLVARAPGPRQLLAGELAIDGDRRRSTAIAVAARAMPLPGYSTAGDIGNNLRAYWSALRTEKLPAS